MARSFLAIMRKSQAGLALTVCAGLLVSEASRPAHAALAVIDAAANQTQVQQLAQMVEQLKSLQEQISEMQKVNQSLGAQGTQFANPLSGLRSELGVIADSMGVDLSTITMPDGSEFGETIGSAKSAMGFIKEALYAVDQLPLKDGEQLVDAFGRELSRGQRVEDRVRARQARETLFRELGDQSLSVSLGARANMQRSIGRVQAIEAANQSAKDLRAQVAVTNAALVAVVSELIEIKGILASQAGLEASRTVIERGQADPLNRRLGAAGDGDGGHDGR
ncbi:MAG: hypothetical protein P1U84_17460 [Parvibaculaceae bacterium]|nr:hypothetical protein [Parvibaculaceae bacterium]